jgi:formylglycine-generating enzyme required for sulfatase activity
MLAYPALAQEPVEIGTFVARLDPDNSHLPSSKIETPSQRLLTERAPELPPLMPVRASPPAPPPPAALTNMTLELGRGITLELVAIHPGTFRMGSAEDGHDGPAHAVTLTRPFLLGKYEVTQAQWTEVTGRNPSTFTNGPDAGRRPVETVTWTDIRDQFLPKLAARLPPGWTPRLPTEAEWEYACRAGSATGFCFGDSTNDLDAYGWYAGNAGQATHPVGLKKPNAWGLYDMHGNVWEWCSDWKAPYPAEAVTDPAGPADGAYRANRGASWHFDPGYCRSARRSLNEPATTRNGNLGFRLAVSAEPRLLDEQDPPAPLTGSR